MGGFWPAESKRAGGCTPPAPVSWLLRRASELSANTHEETTTEGFELNRPCRGVFLDQLLVGEVDALEEQRHVFVDVETERGVELAVFAVEFRQGTAA